MNQLPYRTFAAWWAHYCKGFLVLQTWTPAQSSHAKVEIKQTRKKSVKKLGFEIGIDLALCYSASSNLNQLITYADAGYAGDLDDRKSRSGTVLILNNAPVL